MPKKLSSDDLREIIKNEIYKKDDLVETSDASTTPIEDPIDNDSIDNHETPQPTADSEPSNGQNHNQNNIIRP